MTEKKVIFSKKPNIHKAEKFIDNWVKDTKEKTYIDTKITRTTVYLPDSLRQKLKLNALSKQVTMTAIIQEAIIEYFQNNNTD